MYQDFGRVISSSGEWIRKRGSDPDDIYPFQNSSLIKPSFFGVYASISNRSIGLDDLFSSKSFICEYMGDYQKSFALNFC